MFNKLLLTLMLGPLHVCHGQIDFIGQILIAERYGRGNLGTGVFGI